VSRVKRGSNIIIFTVQSRQDRYRTAAKLDNRRMHHSSIPFVAMYLIGDHPYELVYEAGWNGDIDFLQQITRYKCTSSQIKSVVNSSFKEVGPRRCIFPKPDDFLGAVRKRHCEACKQLNCDRYAPEFAYRWIFRNGLPSEGQINCTFCTHDTLSYYLATVSVPVRLFFLSVYSHAENNHHSQRNF
jgi:hypothetical protein